MEGSQSAFFYIIGFYILFRYFPYVIRATLLLVQSNGPTEGRGSGIGGTLIAGLENHLSFGQKFTARLICSIVS